MRRRRGATSPPSSPPALPAAALDATASLRRLSTTADAATLAGASLACGRPELRDRSMTTSTISSYSSSPPLADTDPAPVPDTTIAAAAAADSASSPAPAAHLGVTPARSLDTFLVASTLGWKARAPRPEEVLGSFSPPNSPRRSFAPNPAIFLLL